MNKKEYLGKVFKSYIPNKNNKGLHYFVIIGVDENCFLVSQGTSVYLKWNNEESHFFKECDLDFYLPEHYDSGNKYYAKNIGNPKNLKKRKLKHKTVFCTEKGGVFYKKDFNYKIRNLDFLDARDLANLINQFLSTKLRKIKYPHNLSKKTKPSKGFEENENNLFKGFEDKKALEILWDSLNIINNNKDKNWRHYEA